MPRLNKSIYCLNEPTEKFLFQKNTRFVNAHFIFIIFSLLIYSLQGQPSTFTFHKLGLNEGLSDLSGIYFEQDSRGLTWISTYNGLNRFDGYNIKAYHPQIDSTKIATNITSKVFEDSDGNLWFSTQEGFHCLLFDSDSIINFTLSIKDTNLIANYYYLFHLDLDKKLWFTAADTLFTFDIEKKSIEKKHIFHSYSCFPIVNQDNQVVGIINPLVEKPGIEILMYLKDGNFRLDEFFVGINPNAFPPAKILFAYIENDQSVWLPSNIGLIHLNPKSPANHQIFKPDSQSRGFNFWGITPFQNRYLWLTSPSKGFFLFDKKTKTFSDKGKNVWIGDQYTELGNGNTIWADKHSNLWISPWNKGLIYTNIQNNKIDHFFRPKKSEQTDNHSVISITEDKEGQLWCSVKNKGVYILNLKSPNPNMDWEEDELIYSTKEPVYLHTSQSGNIWILEKNKILQSSSKNSFTTFLKNSPILSPKKVLEIDSSNFILFDFQDIYLFDNKKYQKIYSSDSLGTFSRIHQCFITKDKKFIISDGISSIYIFESIKDLKKNSYIHIDRFGIANEMIEDKARQSWWFSCDGGLAKMNSSDYSFQYAENSSHFKKQVLNSILLDNEQNIWISSSSNVFKYIPETRHNQVFTVFDGVQSGGFIMATGKKTKDGVLAFGGRIGLNLINPEKANRNQNHAIPYISNIIVNTFDTLKIESKNSHINYSLSHSRNTISLYLISLEYSDPLNNELKYILKGFEEDTISTTSPHEAFYPNLPPGEYQFEVYASNSDGLWNPNPKIIHFQIRPPWWKTLAASLTGLVLITLILISVYNYRIGLIKKREFIKTANAQQKQLLAETETAVLRLQMNPHFIFNSMNSINSYILQKNLTKANIYLTRFASLMRMILDNGAEKFVSIYEENQFLEKYMETEAMRFENGFDYSISIEKDLDPFEYVIPSMILQPFVENAIWHGITGIARKGIIKITYWREGNAIKCSVEDNGSGRKKNTKSKNIDFEDHVSKALKITQKRLDLLEEKDGIKADFYIFDLFNQDKIAVGTKVILCFPIFD